MAIVPRRLVEKMSFFKTHLIAFAQNRAAIGLSTEDVDDLDAKLAAAQAAFKKQREAQLAARSATGDFNIAMKALGNVGAAVIQKVRTHAELTGDPSVYPLASLPMPAGRTAFGPPGTPRDLVASIDAVGQLTLKWICDNPKGSSGTMYQVYRRLGNSGPFAFLGVSGEKRFLDQTIPEGVTLLLYQIRAVRSTAFGESAAFSVTFGSNGQSPIEPFATATKSKQLAA